MKRIFWTALVAALTTALVSSMSLAQTGNSKGKALGHNKKPVCHNGKTLFLPAPAVAAHTRNHGDTEGECGPTGGGENPPDTEPDPDVLVGVGVTGLDPDRDGVIDVLSIDATGCTISEESPAAINVQQDPNADVLQFVEGKNATFDVSGNLQVTILSPGALTTAGGPISILQSTGISCTSIGAPGTLTSGGKVLKTTSGETLKLQPTNNKVSKDLKKLAGSTKVKVKGKPSKEGKTLRVSAVKRR